MGLTAKRSAGRWGSIPTMQCRALLITSKHFDEFRLLLDSSYGTRFHDFVD